MAKLAELLTEKEKLDIESSYLYKHVYQIDVNANVQDLTVKQLSNLGLILIETENRKSIDCFIPSEAINILSNRAIKRKIDLF